MKKTTLLLFFTVLIFVACSSVKTTEKAINTGNYEKAISLSVKNLAKNKYKKKNQPYVLMLQNAFEKAVARDKARISFLTKEDNPQNYEAVYNLYKGLHNRQERIKPLLPLKDVVSGKDASFSFVNYEDAILDAKDKYSDFLYKNGVTLLKEGNRNKLKYRSAYDELQYLNKINSNYKNVRNLLEEAHTKGTDYVFLSVNNDTHQVIPKRLENDLLAIDTYGLNDFWTVYHSKRINDLRYDFDLELNFLRIDVSPEQIHEKEIVKEKQIKDGFKYLKDDKGLFVKDSLGNKIKVDKFKKVKCHLYRITQFKESKVIGEVKYIDNKTNQLVERFPIQSGFVFEHIYANYDGDKRALEESLLNLIALRSVHFPSNEQMIYDAGSDLKQRLKNIISKNKFRN